MSSIHAIMTTRIVVAISQPFNNGQACYYMHLLIMSMFHLENFIVLCIGVELGPHNDGNYAFQI